MVPCSMRSSTTQSALAGWRSAHHTTGSVSHTLQQQQQHQRHQHQLQLQLVLELSSWTGSCWTAACPAAGRECLSRLAQRLGSQLSPVQLEASRLSDTYVSLLQRCLAFEGCLCPPMHPTLPCGVCDSSGQAMCTSTWGSPIPCGLCCCSSDCQQV
jgi:hypothetical protein